MIYPDPSSGRQPYPQTAPDGSQPYNSAPAQYGQGVPQWSARPGEPAMRPARHADPVQSLTLATAVTGLLAWLLDLFVGVSPLSFFSIAAAALAVISLLPSTAKHHLPNLVPYVALLAIVGGLNGIGSAVHVPLELDTAIGVIVLVLVLLQLLAGVATLLLAQGVLKAPQRKPRMAQQPPWVGNQPYGQQAYAGQYGQGPAGQSPMQQSPAQQQQQQSAAPSSVSSPASSPTSGPQQGHFDLSQFPAARPTDSGTAQFPPSGGFGQ